MALADVLSRLETRDIRRHDLAPGVHAMRARRPMTRVRAYQSAGLNPFAGRASPSEQVLLAHVHEDAEGRAKLIEGFNGAEGARMAEMARGELEKAGLLAPDVEFHPMQALKACPYTGFR